MSPDDYVSPEESYMIMHQRNPGLPEPPFEDRAMQEKIWGRKWGQNTDVGRLRMVLLSRPGPEWDQMKKGGEFVEDIGAWIGPEQMWYWYGRERPDMEKINTYHDGLVAALEAEEVEVVFLEDPLPHMTKSVFTRDQAIVVKGGAIICRFGVQYRQGEELTITKTLANLGMPILHTVHGTGLMEGGSFLWLNETTAAVAIGHRSDMEGAIQVAEVLERQGVDLLFVDNLGYGLHIDGSMVMVDADLAVAFTHELPWWFCEKLKELGIKIVYADLRDGAFGVNCLAVRPGKVIMSSHAARTAERLRKTGTEVVLIDYDEFHKGGGGVHCSTLPLIRDEV
jgi:N-dimethylarginine dimethylaminohydrolase